MNLRKFGSDSLKISEVGLGCWQLGADWGSIPDNTAIEILECALDQGITFLDTADVYGMGRSESLIGDFLKTHTESVFVATKAGRKDLFPDQYTAKGLKTCIVNSLQRLKIDCLDLVQMHCIPFEVMQQAEIWGWLNDLKKEGLIKRFGASVESMEEANWCIDNVSELYSLQIIFNVFRQKPITHLFDKALKKKIGIIARVPLASGLLSGKFTKETRFGESDHRNYNANGEAFNVGETFAGLPFDEGIELISELNSLRQDNTPLAQWSLRWILDHPAVSTVIPGASSPKHVASNVGASSLPPLSQSTMSQITAFYNEKVASKIRGPY